MPDMSLSDLDPSLPFTRAQALAAGVRTAELRSAAVGGVHRGIYRMAATPVTPVLSAQAAILAVGKPAFASHSTAARLWGLPIPTLPDEHVTVMDQAHRRHRPGLICHLATAAQDIVRLQGVACSSPRQVFAELASLVSLVDVVVVGDHLVRQRLATLAVLRAFVTERTGAGSSTARSAATLVRERVDSPMETRLRLLLVLAGLPEPTVNPSLEIAGLVRRFDLAWDAARVVVEYDGRHHIQRQQQWAADLRRREQIEAAGWRVIVVIAGDVYGAPSATIERVADALRAGGMRLAPLSERWRRHFPDRSAA